MDQRINIDTHFQMNKPKTFLSKSGRECYLSGIEEENAIVRYIDNGEIARVKLELIKKYIR